MGWQIEECNDMHMWNVTMKPLFNNNFNIKNKRERAFKIKTKQNKNHRVFNKGMVAYISWLQKQTEKTDIYSIIS